MTASFLRILLIFVLTSYLKASLLWMLFNSISIFYKLLWSVELWNIMNSTILPPFLCIEVNKSYISWNIIDLSKTLITEGSYMTTKNGYLLNRIIDSFLWLTKLKFIILKPFLLTLRSQRPELTKLLSILMVFILKFVKNCL